MILRGKRKLAAFALAAAVILLAAISASAFEPEETGPFGDVKPGQTANERLSQLYAKQRKELYYYGGINTGLFVYAPDSPYPYEPEDDLHAMAWDYFESLENMPNTMVIFYSAYTNECAAAYGANVAELLSAEDIAAVEAAFTAPDGSDPYVHVCNGFKQLLIRVFDGGDLTYPAYSYIAESLRDPASIPDSAPLPDSRLLMELEKTEETQLVYLANEIGRCAGLSVDVLITAAGDASLTELAESYRTNEFDDDPETTVILAYALDTGESCFLADERILAQLPADADERIAAALSDAADSGFARALAGLEELARILFADGTREYGAFSGVALALDPDAFAEPSGTPAAMWAALAVVLLAAALLAVCLRMRKKRVG